MPVLNIKMFNLESQIIRVVEVKGGGPMVDEESHSGFISIFALFFILNTKIVFKSKINQNKIEMKPPGT